MAIRKRKNKNNPFELIKINPLNGNQEEVIRQYDNGHHLVLHGYAGTGKTYLSLWLALEELLTKGEFYDRIVIVRSAVPSRDMGFLPGSAKEKARIFEEPYKQICDELFDRGDGYEILKTQKRVEFTTTSYLRGITFARSMVIVDEIQNMSFQELDKVITRMGDTSRIVMCGDFRQTDLDDGNGLDKFLSITKRIPSFKYIEFRKEDIVRSGLVKDYIIAKEEYKDAKQP